LVDAVAGEWRRCESPTAIKTPFERAAVGMCSQRKCVTVKISSHAQDMVFFRAVRTTIRGR